MFVLVFWKKTGDVSVVKIDQLQTNVDEGKETAVRYSDGQMYEALVVKKSYDEKYLRKIDVGSDGKILPQKSRLQSSKASQKKNSGATSSVVQKKKMVEASNQKVSALPSIFNDLIGYGTDSENSDEDNFKVSSVKRKRAHLIESSDEDLEFMKKKKDDGAVSNDDIIENNFSSEEDNDDYLTGREEEDRERIELQVREREERERERLEGQRRNQERVDREREDQRRQLAEEREREDQQRQLAEEREREDQQRQLAEEREREDHQRQLAEERERVRQREVQDPLQAFEAPRENRGDADQLIRCRQGGNGRVQLTKTYNVWIDKARLTYFQRFLHDPRSLTRHLIKELVGEGNLIDMCARGRSTTNRTGIPKEILNAVEFYVNSKCHPLYLKPVDFTNVINNMIASVRHPRR